MSVTFRFLHYHKIHLVAVECFLLVVLSRLNPTTQLPPCERKLIGQVVLRLAGDKSHGRFYKIDLQDFWDSMLRRSCCLAKSITAENLNNVDVQSADSGSK